MDSSPLRANRSLLLYPVMVLMVASLAIPAVVGCSSLPKSWQVKRPDQWEPDPSEFDDKWAELGKEARGNRPLEKNADPLDKMLWSDKAAQINRNLGVE